MEEMNTNIEMEVIGEIVEESTDVVEVIEDFGTMNENGSNKMVIGAVVIGAVIAGGYGLKKLWDKKKAKKEATSSEQKLADTLDKVQVMQDQETVENEKIEN